MKYRKIFTFILLLCTIFCTLLVISPTINAQNDSQSDIYFSDSIPSPIVLDSDCGVYYEINFSNYWVPLITRDTPLPYWVRGVDNWRFRNDNRIYDLDIYLYGNYSGITLEPGEVSDWYPTGETLDIGFSMHTSANPLPVDKVIISGKYRFNTQVTLDIFDLVESEKDLTFPGYFRFADGLGTNYNRIYCSLWDTIGYYLNIDNISIVDSQMVLGEINAEKTLATIYSSRRLFYFEPQMVDIDTYNWLIENGQFGEFSEPIPDIDNPFTWLINCVNDFLQIEIIPGFKFIHIMYIFVTIPLSIYILKLFLGG